MFNLFPFAACFEETVFLKIFPEGRNSPVFERVQRIRNGPFWNEVVFSVSIPMPTSEVINQTALSEVQSLISQVRKLVEVVTGRKIGTNEFATVQCVNLPLLYLKELHAKLRFATDVHSKNEEVLRKLDFFGLRANNKENWFGALNSRGVQLRTKDEHDGLPPVPADLKFGLGAEELDEKLDFDQVKEIHRIKTTNFYDFGHNKTFLTLPFTSTDTENRKKELAQRIEKGDHVELLRLFFGSQLRNVW
jgi:hypothetical protein